MLAEFCAEPVQPDNTILKGVGAAVVPAVDSAEVETVGNVTVFDALPPLTEILHVVSVTLPLIVMVPSDAKAVFAVKAIKSVAKVVDNDYCFIFYLIPQINTKINKSIYN